MDYKKALEDIKNLFVKLEAVEPEVKEEVLEQVDLATEKEPIEQPEVVEKEPVGEYVSLEAFNKYKGEVQELFSKVVEMLGQNEKNTVPKELKKEEIEIESTELSTLENVVTHTDEVETEVQGNRFNNNKKDSIKDRVYNALWN